MPTSRRKPPAIPDLRVTNLTSDYLYLGVKAHGMQGIWLAPNGQEDDSVVLVGLDFNDWRVVDTLKNLANELKISVSLDEDVLTGLGIATTTTVV